MELGRGKVRGSEDGQSEEVGDCKVRREKTTNEEHRVKGNTAPVKGTEKVTAKMVGIFLEGV